MFKSIGELWQCDQCRSAEFKALPIFLVVHGADVFFWSIARQHVSSRLERAETR
jgi:hypothetical protein